MDCVKRWFFGLVELLSNIRGDDDAGDNSEGGDGSSAGDNSEDAGEGSEGSDDANDDGENVEDENEDADVDSGKDDGKDRSQTIPRDRFDKVNAKAKRVEALEAAGVLVEDSGGNLSINPKALKSITGQEDDKGTEKVDFKFTKDDVDDASWPLMEKINKRTDHVDSSIAKVMFVQAQLGSQLRMVAEYPEFIQKDSALKKAALDIMKNDAEFKKSYRGNPEALYWAVKRAAGKSSDKQPPKGKPKKKPGFIVGKGDSGKSSPKVVDLSKLSKTELDDLERKEHERLSGTGRK